MDPIREYAVRSAFTGASAANLFGGSITTRIVSAFENEEDSTDWATIEDVENSLLQTRVRLQHGADSQFKAVPRGQAALEFTIDVAGAETYRVARFAKKLMLDEQDILDADVNLLSIALRDSGRMQGGRKSTCVITL